MRGSSGSGSHHYLSRRKPVARKSVAVTATDFTFAGLDSGRATVANHCVTNYEGEPYEKHKERAVARMSARVRTNCFDGAGADHRRSGNRGAWRQSNYRDR